MILHCAQIQIFPLAIPVIKLFPFLTSPNTNNSLIYYSSDLSFLHCVQVLSSYLQPFGVHLEEETSRKVPSGTTVSSKDRAAYGAVQYNSHQPHVAAEHLTGG